MQSFGQKKSLWHIRNNIWLHLDDMFGCGYNRLNNVSHAWKCLQIVQLSGFRWAMDKSRFFLNNAPEPRSQDPQFLETLLILSSWFARRFQDSDCPGFVLSLWRMWCVEYIFNIINQFFGTIDFWSDEHIFVLCYVMFHSILLTHFLATMGLWTLLAHFR